MDFNERVRRRNEFDASVVYGTRKFNLLTGRDKHMDYRKDHDDQWTDRNTRLIREDVSEARACPLCGSVRADTLFVKCGFPHVTCKTCGLVYVTPILNRREYEKLWSAEDSWESILESKEQIRMQSLEARYSLDVALLYLEKRAGRKVSVCDVGCGPGTLLTEAKKRGYSVFGIEPNARCHAILKKKRIDYMGGFFPLRRGFNRKFDVVFLLNTLEHLRDPLQTVREAKRLLRPEGVLYISVPCIDALVNRIMREKAGVFAGHSHVQFFNKETLALLFEKAGFEVLEYETIITEIGVIKNYLSYKDPYFGHDEAAAVDFLTPELIYKNNLARNINMVGRLKGSGRGKIRQRHI